MGSFWIWPALFCLSATLATDRICGVAMSTFDSNWYEFPVEMQKYIILIIARSQKPAYFDGMKLVHCTLQTLTVVSGILDQFCTWRKSWRIFEFNSVQKINLHFRICIKTCLCCSFTVVEKLVFLLHPLQDDFTVLIEWKNILSITQFWTRKWRWRIYSVDSIKWSWYTPSEGKIFIVKWQFLLFVHFFTLLLSWCLSIISNDVDIIFPWNKS